MFIKANNDLIYLDRLIKCEFTPAPHNTSSISITYTIDNLVTKEPVITSIFAKVNKNALNIITDAINNNLDYVDISL